MNELNLEQIKKIDTAKYYLINWNTYLDMNNKKLKDFFNYLKQDNKFIFVDDTNENIKSFIWKNQKKEIILIFPTYSADKKKSSDLNDFFNFLKSKIRQEIDLIKFINTIDNLKIKIIWHLEDIYNGIKERNILNKYIYNSNFIHLLGGPHKYIFENYILNSSEQTDIKIEKRRALIERYIYFSNFYCYYNIYNTNPQHSIILSGKINLQYPERIKLLNLKNQNVVLLKYDFNYRFKNKTDEYVKILSKFLCSFVSCATSSIYKFGIVHKIYEVLSAGCLLLCPESHENLLKKIGLVKNVNYMCINLNQDPDKTINFICNEKNRNVINNIRKKGHELAKNIFTPENKYKEFLNIIEQY